MATAAQLRPVESRAEDAVAISESAEQALADIRMHYGHDPAVSDEQIFIAVFAHCPDVFDIVARALDECEKYKKCVAAGTPECYKPPCRLTRATMREYSSLRRLATA